MSYKKGKILFVILMIFSVDCYSQSIQNAVKRMMHDYPQSTLQDMYKSFFQDQFGLGHLVSDSVSARNYLRQEIEESEHFSYLEFEPTGYKKNFYRVNLSLVKSGMISFEDYFQAFMKSARDNHPITLYKWEREWKKILRIISDMDLGLKDFESDKKAIDSLLRNGQYACHHSQTYNQLYHPHYRLIKRKIAKKLLKKINDK